MTIQFSLQDIMLFLLYTLGISSGILLFSILWKVNKAFRTIPSILEDVGQISINVRETTDKLKVSVPVILQEVENVTYAAKGSIVLAGAVMENMGTGVNETVATYRKDTIGFMTYLPIFEELLQILYRAFSQRK